MDWFSQLCCWSLAQTGHKLLDYPLHRQAAGPFMMEAPHASAKPMLVRPYGALFALHDSDQYVFTCSRAGSTVYWSAGGGDMKTVQQFGDHRQQVLIIIIIL